MTSESEDDDFLSADEGDSDKEENLSPKSSTEVKESLKRNKNLPLKTEKSSENKEAVSLGTKKAEKNVDQHLASDVSTKKTSSTALKEDKGAKQKPQKNKKSNISENSLQASEVLTKKGSDIVLKEDSEARQKPQKNKKLNISETPCQVSEVPNKKGSNTVIQEVEGAKQKPQSNIKSNTSEIPLKENVKEDSIEKEAIKEPSHEENSDKTHPQYFDSTKSEDKRVKAEFDMEESSPGIGKLEDKSLESKEETDIIKSDEPKQKSSYEEGKIKPAKESKIGLKKPRERLGERLGNKKLGSRVTKPLIGISSDSFQKQHENSQQVKDEPHSPIADPSNEEPINLGTKTLQTSNVSNEEESSWASWGDWGSTFITAASTLTKEVTRGVETVLETVESGIGAPDPMELAKELVEEEKKRNELLGEETKDRLPEEKLIEEEKKMSRQKEMRKQVLLGGLDTLEKIGRRTMDIIQDGDPGLRNKRNFLKANKANLSMVLREARERAIEEEEERSASGSGTEARKNNVSLALVWDNTEGPVHMEALSLVSKQCQGRTAGLVQDMPPLWREKIQTRIAEIKAHACIDEEHRVDDISASLSNITRDVQLPLQFSRVLTGWPALQDALHKLSIEIRGLGCADLSSVQADLYKAIAEYVSQVVGAVHKGAEVALITEGLDGLRLAKQFQRICGCISGGLEGAADDVCEAISQALPASDPQFNDTITNIYVQMAEANSYLETSLGHLNKVIIQAEVKIISNEL